MFTIYEENSIVVVIARAILSLIRDCFSMGIHILIGY